MQFTRRWLAPSLLVALIVTTAGCAPGIRWRPGRFEGARADARTQNKLIFVYFRNWHSVQCMHFEEQVLKQTPVRSATADMVCVRREYDVRANRKLATNWVITSVPAYAILDPAGTLLATEAGKITAESLLAAIEQAKSRVASTTPHPSSSP